MEKIGEQKIYDTVSFQTPLSEATINKKKVYRINIRKEATALLQPRNKEIFTITITRTGTSIQERANGITNKR